ncbi:MAG: ABC transporter permease [Halothiobacillaceae bacterium]
MIDQPARFEIERENARLRLFGDWTVRGVGRLHTDSVPVLPQGGRLVVDASELGRMDTGGALLYLRLVDRLQSSGGQVDAGSLPDRVTGLLALVARRRADGPFEAPPADGPLAALGRRTVLFLAEFRSHLAFLGELTLRLLPALLRPWTIRWREVVHEIHLAGVQALFIVGLLSFLIGMVLAYQGGATLEQYGANILIVNMVAVVTLREMAPLITSILVAGRTGSSYAAQIGTMKITEEIDALRALGIHPMDMLVVPKVIALIVVMPLLFVYADLMGLLGGAVVADLIFGVSSRTFIDRLSEVVTLSTFLVGLVKAPVFAVVIASIGCHAGMNVSGSAAAVGQATTVSVVQAIFTVIVLDALFSILFNLMGV